LCDVSGSLETLAVLETHAIFPRRINVHFVQVHSPAKSRCAPGARQRHHAGLRHRASAVCVPHLAGKGDRKILAHLPAAHLELEWPSTAAFT